MGFVDKALVCAMVTTLIGCAKGGDSAAAPPKSLWSVWTRSDSAITINLTGGNLGINQVFAITFGNGVKCSCNLIMTGTEANGSYTLSSCTYSSGGGGDPGCTSLNSSGTFTNSANTLRLCDPTCGIYN